MSSLFLKIDTEVVILYGRLFQKLIVHTPEKSERALSWAKGHMWYNSELKMSVYKSVGNICAPERIYWHTYVLNTYTYVSNLFFAVIAM